MDTDMSIRIAAGAFIGFVWLLVGIRIGIWIGKSEMHTVDVDGDGNIWTDKKVRVIRRPRVQVQMQRGPVQRRPDREAGPDDIP